MSSSRVVAHVPESLLAKIDALAATERRSRSAMVAILIDEGLALESRTSASAADAGPRTSRPAASPGPVESRTPDAAAVGESRASAPAASSGAARPRKLASPARPKPAGACPMRVPRGLFCKTCGKTH